ncbi:hypothetical protein H9Q74_011023 [Fusarium xylarioides]|nr:hypothetical protein H9Q71_010097 [Fusarium xylarioides]KAG5816631.1 hypothetical protein H9Q74_011023 [Fusarium xylarioides]
MAFKEQQNLSNYVQGIGVYDHYSPAGRGGSETWYCTWEKGGWSQQHSVVAQIGGQGYYPGTSPTAIVQDNNNLQLFWVGSGGPDQGLLYSDHALNPYSWTGRRNLGSNTKASLVSTQYFLKLWDQRFESLSVTSQEEEKHVTALRMRRIMVEVTLNLATNTNDGAKGTVDTHCKAILDLALQLIHDLGLRPAQAGFYLANGLVEALYFVAVTSEDWDLRQKAIHILRQYRFTDGVWGSNAAADLAESRLQRDIYRYRQQLEA